MLLRFAYQTSLKDCPAVELGASEYCFVNLTIGILRHHRPKCAVSSNGAATVTNGEIAARETVFVFNQVLGALDELTSGRAVF